MLVNFLKSIRGAICLILYLLAMIVVAASVIIFALPIKLIPIKSWRYHANKLLLKLPTLWMDLNKLIMLLSTYNKIDIHGADELNAETWHIMLANHSSWLDILIVGCVFKHKLPTLKFFMKKELLWTLPLAGLACYLLGYPFLDRHTAKDIRKNPALKGKDIETAKQACNKFKAYPTTVMSFVEGTRFSEEKRQKQLSPYQYLLKPKIGGLAVVLNELKDELSDIVNVTIHYSEKELSLWQFVCGNFTKIHVYYEVLPITDDMIGDYYTDRMFRKQLQRWANDVWERKDTLLGSLRET